MTLVDWLTAVALVALTHYAYQLRRTIERGAEQHANALASLTARAKAAETLAEKAVRDLGATVNAEAILRARADEVTFLRERLVLAENTIAAMSDRVAQAQVAGQQMERDGKRKAPAAMTIPTSAGHRWQERPSGPLADPKPAMLIEPIGGPSKPSGPAA